MRGSAREDEEKEEDDDDDDDYEEESVATLATGAMLVATSLFPPFNPMLTGKAGPLSCGWRRIVRTLRHCLTYSVRARENVAKIRDNTLSTRNDRVRTARNRESLGEIGSRVGHTFRFMSR